MLFTLPEEDWSYCMYESGIATKQEYTRILVFEGGDVPSPLQHLITYKYTKKDIYKFTQEFHSEKGFFYRNEISSYAPGANEQLIESSANMLWEDLKKENPIKRKREIERWLFIELYLKLDSNELESIRNAESDKLALEEVEDVIKDKCFVAKDSNTSALGHFGYAENVSGLTLNDLFKRWCQDIDEWNKKQGMNHDKLNWYSEVVMEIIRVIRHRPASEVTKPMKSVKPDDFTWYLPVLNRASALETDLEWEFRIELYRVTPEAPVQSDSELRARVRKMNVQQAKKLNDIALDRDLFKLYHRVSQKIAGSNQYDINEFIKETIHDTNETWNEFLPPFQSSELRSLTQLYEMYSNGGAKLKNKLEEILNSDSESEEKKKKVFSVLFDNAFKMKKYFRECLLKEERKEPLLSVPFGDG